MNEFEGTTCLMLTDSQFMVRTPVFEGHGALGNGYDWAAVAEVVAGDVLAAGQADELDYDPEAGMMCVYGPPAVLNTLAVAMAAIFHDTAALDGVCARAELD